MQLTENYLRRGEEPLLKWKNFYLDEWESVQSQPMVESLVPLFGSKEFESLSDREKSNLYFEFIRFNAEVIVYLEKMFCDYYRDQVKGRGIPEKMHEAIKLLVQEEDYHTIAYKEFLKQENWESKHFILNNKTINIITKAIVNLSPFAVLIIGGKAEAYSVNYATHLRNCYGSWEKNNWSMLNYLHLKDETNHYPFQVEVYKEAYRNAGPLKEVKKLIASLSFFLLMQYVFVRSHYMIMKRCLEGRNLWERIKLTLRFCRWTALEFSPMVMARTNIKRVIKQYDVKYAPVFSFLYK